MTAQVPPRPPRPSRFPVYRPAAAAGTVISDINTTPLICVLLLLVTLILTLPIMTHAVRLEFSSREPPFSMDLLPIVDLDIDFDGTVVWNGTAVPYEQLDAYFAVEARKDPQPEVYLHADRRARYDVVARTLALAQRRGMKRIGIVETGNRQDD
jgi:biopolymer transport protein ExbD